MSAFGNEIGKTLDKHLRRFAVNDYSAIDIIETRSANYDLSKEILFALYRRDYIRNIDRKTYSKPSDIPIDDIFTITIEGIDYIELNKKWWTRFWFSSLACPAAVSFLTSLAINLISRWLG